MDAHIQNAEIAGTNEARLEAYESLRQMIAWLVAGEAKRGSTHVTTETQP
jgi:hypothetical protein